MIELAIIVGIAAGALLFMAGVSTSNLSLVLLGLVTIPATLIVGLSRLRAPGTSVAPPPGVGAEGAHRERASGGRGEIGSSPDKVIQRGEPSVDVSGQHERDAGGPET